MLTRVTMTIPDPAKYNLTTSDVCRVLDINRVTLWRWIRDGDFPKATKIGKKKRWCAADLGKASVA